MRKVSYRKGHDNLKFFSPFQQTFILVAPALAVDKSSTDAVFNYTFFAYFGLDANNFLPNPTFTIAFSNVESTKIIKKAIYKAVV